MSCEKPGNLSKALEALEQSNLIQEAERPLWHVMKNSCQGDTPPVAPGAPSLPSRIDPDVWFHSGWG